MTPNDIQKAQQANLLDFLLTAPNQLANKPSLVPNADFTYCSLALTCNESISSVRWNGVCYMTGSDVVRIVAVRLASAGIAEPDTKLLKRNVVSRLRTIKEGRGMLLEPANSRLLTLLFQHNLISTRKSQKLFCWYQVPHDQLLEHELAHHRWKAGLPPLPKTLLRAPAFVDGDYPADHRLRRVACGVGDCPRRFTRLEHAQRHRAAHVQEKPLEGTTARIDRTANE
ncbi:hypothetical protein BMF94_4087 [Rhodotorula taiwanensis]|uniref:C2H2-type domain-containing protein n=1 Tax=Rhodotorula taiwanensis TaxID=741276 RepID=A0A2S5B828_9BASI|nr:hypothetical protein BMF94_4087 [Rhodotorula taiwanensis]